MFPPLLISSISFEKNPRDGLWQVTAIKTNKGSFQLGPIENATLNRERLDELIELLSDPIRHQIVDFLQSEQPKDTK